MKINYRTLQTGLALAFLLNSGYNMKKHLELDAEFKKQYPVVATVDSLNTEINSVVSDIKSITGFSYKKDDSATIDSLLNRAYSINSALDSVASTENYKVNYEDNPNRTGNTSNKASTRSLFALLFGTAGIVLGVGRLMDKYRDD